MKICISGTSGIGKTTTAKLLAKKLEIPYLPENFDNKITRSKEKSLEVWQKEMRAVLEEKSNLENSLQNWCSDRGVLDLINTWFNNHLHARSTLKQSDEYIKKCLLQLKKYDFLVILPWNGIPFSLHDKDRPGIKRQNNPFARLRNHSQILGLAHIYFDNRKIIEVPNRVKNQNERIDYIVNVINKRKSLI